MEIETLLENTRFLDGLFSIITPLILRHHTYPPTHTWQDSNQCSARLIVLGHGTNKNVRSGIRTSNLNNQDKTFAKDRKATGTGKTTVHIFYLSN